VIQFLDRENLKRFGTLPLNRESQGDTFGSSRKSTALVVPIAVIATAEPTFRRNRRGFRTRMADSVVFVNQREPRASMEGDRDKLQWLEVPARHTCSIAG